VKRSLLHAIIGDAPNKKVIADRPRVEIQRVRESHSAGQGARAEDRAVARFILLTPIVGGPIKYPSGTTVADSAAHAIGNDVVWPQLCASPTPLAMAPLDAAAQALLPGNPPIYPSASYYINSTAFGVGLDAGR
jgi:hypothetical protein